MIFVTSMVNWNCQEMKCLIMTELPSDTIFTVSITDVRIYFGLLPAFLKMIWGPRPGILIF